MLTVTGHVDYRWHRYRDSD